MTIIDKRMKVIVGFSAGIAAVVVIGVIASASMATTPTKTFDYSSATLGQSRDELVSSLSSYFGPHSNLTNSRSSMFRNYNNVNATAYDIHIDYYCNQVGTVTVVGNDDQIIAVLLSIPMGDKVALSVKGFIIDTFFLVTVPEWDSDEYAKVLKEAAINASEDKVFAIGEKEITLHVEREGTTGEERIFKVLAVGNNA